MTLTHRLRFSIKQCSSNVKVFCSTQDNMAILVSVSSLCAWVSRIKMPVFIYTSELKVFKWDICCFSIDKSCLILWTSMDCRLPGFPILYYLLEFAQTHVHWVLMPSSHLILCHPLLLLIVPSNRVFSSELALSIRWPKCWNSSFNISPSNEYSGLISFGMDWFDLLAVQGTLKRLHHHSLKASVLQHSAFFMVHSHICTWLLEKP